MGLIAAIIYYLSVNMMSRTQQAASVAALCLTILMAGLFIAYKPGMPADDTTKTGPLIPGTGIGSTGYKSITEGTTPIKTMSVSGTGTISVKANQAIIVLGVYTEGKLASTAIDENSVLMNEVVKVLKAAGITEDNMQTMGYNVVPIYNWEVRMNIGYQVTNSLQIKVNDLTKVGAVIDAASAAGANSNKLNEAQFKQYVAETVIGNLMRDFPSETKEAIHRVK